MTAPAAALFAPGPRRSHRAVSPCSEAFLDFVERHPEALERSTFESLERPPSALFPYPLQSWPLFVDRATAAALGRAVAGLAALVRSLPERVFDGDAGRVCEYFGIEAEGAEVIARVLASPRLASGCVMRGDFIAAESGLRCLELNVSANLGGIFVGPWAAAYFGVGLLRRFCDELGAEVSCRDPLRELVRYAISRARSRGLGADGEINLAVASRGLRPGEEAATLPYVEREYRRVLAAAGGELRGEAMVTDYPEIERDERGLSVRGRRIHVLLEHYQGYLVRPVLEAWLEGAVDVYAGPMARILDDKRCLALLSELADSGLFDREEAALIDGLVPWTRPLADGYVTYRGERATLVELLAARREQMVIKPALGIGGEGVHVGLFTPRESWRAAIRSGLEAGDRIVQEYVPPRPLLAQRGESGFAPHDVNWGLFCFGRRFGGAFLRLVPTSEHGVVNARRGATETILLEVGPVAEPGRGPDPMIHSYRPPGGPGAEPDRREA